MDWRDIAVVVGKVAPIAGTLIGGPAGAAIGGLLAAALGTAATPDAITQAIATDPTAALKLAQWEGDNKVKLQAMAYAHAEALITADTAQTLSDAADRKSARDSAVASSNTKPLFWLSLGLLAVTLGAELAAVFGALPKDADPMVVGRVLGLMDAVAMMVLTFNYGSSTGSKRANELLAQAPAITAR